MPWTKAELEVEYTREAVALAAFAISAIRENFPDGINFMQLGPEFRELADIIMYNDVGPPGNDAAKTILGYSGSDDSAAEALATLNVCRLELEAAQR